mmetsp:Transcript_16606/g.39440  ORF Transcript_16606/g.39440 Transcript_16606/m.39440 type:complete len:203 (+) Transcript_16606:755-1363(+)
MKDGASLPSWHFLPVIGPEVKRSFSFAMSSESQKRLTRSRQPSSRSGTLKQSSSSFSTEASFSLTTCLSNSRALGPCATILPQIFGEMPGAASVPSNARLTMASRLPHFCSSVAALLAPMPGIPGMLSAESPISASRSGIWSGRTPHLFQTSLLSIRTKPERFLSRGVSSNSTWSPTSSRRSLSQDTIFTWQLDPPALNRRV